VSAVTPQAIGEMPTIATPAPPGLWRDPDLTVPHTPTPIRKSSVVPAPAPVSARTPASAVAKPAPAAAKPAPTVKVPATERTSTTVVLGRPHLMALGVLGLLVTAGIVVLAFAALRGKSDPGAVVPAPSTQAEMAPAPATPAPAAPESPPAAAVPAPPPAPASPSAAVPAPPQGSKPTSAATTVGQTPAAPEKGVATAGAGPAGAKPAGRVAAPTTGVSPGGSPTRPAPAATETAPAAAPTPTPTPTPVAAVPPVTFNEVRLLVADGDRARERQGMLQLGDGHVSVVSESGGAPMMSLANGAVTGIFYSRSKQPRWRDASGQTVESKLDLGPLGFLRGDRNWVILLTAGEPVILRIEDSAMRTLLPALQERTGKTVQR
jgi:hypothetical protein